MHAVRGERQSIVSGMARDAFAAAKILGLHALNARALERAQASVRLGGEKRHLQRLEERVDRLNAGERAAVDKAPVRQAAVFFNLMLGPTGLKEAVNRRLAHRSRKVFEQIREHVVGETALDLGSGDGRVGELVARELEKEVTLCDVVDYNASSLPLVVYDGRKLPFADKSFDCSVVLVVLHHANDPLKVLDEVFRVTRGRIIIVESVYFNETHRRVNAFLDWFYNRVLNDPRVNVPLNFLRPAGWVGEIEKRGGKIVEMKHLGIDQPIVPEWHTLYAVDLEKKEVEKNASITH